MGYRDLREYLVALQEAGKLRIVEERISKDTELMPLVRWQYRGLPEEQRTGWWFKNITDAKGRTYNSSAAVAVIGGSRQIYAMGMQCKPEEITAKWDAALENPILPRLVSTGPCKEEIHKGNTLLEHGGLEELPVPISTPGFDCAPYFTSGLWHTKDPETGILNVGTYRAMLKGPLKTGISGRLNHFFVHWEKCKQLGKPLEAALVLGAAPSVCMCSVTNVPYGVDELAIAGAIDGEPIDVVRCETVDLVVPANAEIIIEGEILTDYYEPEAPFGEYTGYMSERDLKPVFVVKCITHRKQPIYHAFMSQMPPSESSRVRSIAEEATFLRFLKKDCGIQTVTDVAFPEESGGAWQVCVIQLKKTWQPRPTHGQVWQALTAALSRNSGFPKIVIAVDDDIDPRDMNSVMWAMAFRFQPHLDMKVIEGRYSALDPSSAPVTEHISERFFPMGPTGPRGCSAVLIDATRKWTIDAVALPREEYMLHAKELWEKMGFPSLTPRKPWHGYELGQWNEEKQREADLAIRGEYFQTGAKLAEQGEII